MFSFGRDHQTVVLSVYSGTSKVWQSGCCTASAWGVVSPFHVDLLVGAWR
jgi:hypothetical protein